jgi:hypothetical protein
MEHKWLSPSRSAPSAQKSLELKPDTLGFADRCPTFSASEGTALHHSEPLGRRGSRDGECSSQFIVVAVRDIHFDPERQLRVMGF